MKRVERGRSTQSVDVLRRELREADRERYYMQAAINTAADEWLSRQPRHRVARRTTAMAILASAAGVCLLLLGWIGSERLRNSPPVGEGSSVTAPSTPVNAQIADRTEKPDREAIQIADRSGNPDGETIAVLPHRAITTPAKRSVRASGSRAVPAQRQTIKPGPMVPRPLSPSEFGRTPSR
jgi:hypothetical protein